MPRPHLTVAVAALALTAACLADAALRSGDFPHAAATRACGPTDGPAVAIYLATVPIESLAPRPPYIHITVWQSLEHLPGGSWRIAAGGTTAAAWYYSASNDFEVATVGHLMVSAVLPDSSIQGSVDVTFPAAGRVSGALRSRWISRALLCG